MTLPYPLNQEDLDLIELEIKAQYEMEEIKAFQTFQAFWGEIDVANAYEEDWENEKEYWRPYYYAIFTKIKNSKDGI